MPFKVDLDRCPIDVGADKYVDHHGPNPEYTSVISAQLTVAASSAILADMLADVEATEIDEVVVIGVNGTDTEFSGTLAPHAAMNIASGSVTFTITVGAAAVDDIEDTDGILAGTGVAGTINYVTGAWTLVCDTAPDALSNIIVTYDWYHVVPAATPVQALWLTPGAADEIYATFSADGEPTASTGILVSEAMYIAGQPDLLANARFYGNDTLMDIEVLV